ncbi:asparaginase [Acetobacter nitrogenifigens DSM 23921 = NBRC 105050]|uniref:Isoaspartyl peptidase n=1 Tax=Acetobacter nitrogenifigens DSM 23921 = NBRC 105050 TaxID=1120919 RepID=A0A511XEM5_9PROT|nr:isoaspartyl peptidase/L-asparaginase [Acetobacter nitrogenifigens]GBQ96639.1 asparaginase [Acetobacter nitrogenifigens DSM 23921 = NBRC 105050]GEN61396.1 isoaspartyl peptidase/L-asparaginase [Acetobacter nitrogenifigens DSM 23921 = NBRC 105050]
MTTVPTRTVIALHGGCGVMSRALLSEAEWEDACADIRKALEAGYTVLSEGGSAVEAVEACVTVLEDSPHFNAGHGAALNANGQHELDASIMDGATAQAGAVAGAQAVRNPVRLARKLMGQTIPMMLAGPAADAYAVTQGLETMPQSYFTTPRRAEALAAMRAHDRLGTFASESEKHGTVGAVALDCAGNLAAATSTGGFTNKAVGRVGDSAVIGAGTYARNGICAVSCTGQGEQFIRHVVAHDIAARICYGNQTLTEAARTILAESFTPHGIGGGIIAIDQEGTICAEFNTEGMFRGWIDADGALFVATHRD